MELALHICSMQILLVTLADFGTSEMSWKFKRKMYMKSTWENVGGNIE